MDHHLDTLGVARERRFDEAVRRIQHAAEFGWEHAPDIVAGADKPIAEMTVEETRDAMYEECAGIRLDLIFCGALPGELRKRWANRLGTLDLGVPATPQAIEKFCEGLTVFGGDADLDLADIRARLWHLRALCLRHQQLRSPAVRPA
jgi:hypothetical protein